MSRLPAKDRPTILIAEDEPIIARNVAGALRESGFHTRCIKDGVTAINWIYFARPTAIVLDLMLPRLSGAEICMMVRKTEGVSTTPIVIISGENAMNQNPQRFELGTDD